MAVARADVRLDATAAASGGAAGRCRGAERGQRRAWIGHEAAAGADLVHRSAVGAGHDLHAMRATARMNAEVAGRAGRDAVRGRRAAGAAPSAPGAPTTRGSGRARCSSCSGGSGHSADSGRSRGSAGCGRSGGSTVISRPSHPARTRGTAGGSGAARPRAATASLSAARPATTTRCQREQTQQRPQTRDISVRVCHAGPKAPPPRAATHAKFSHERPLTQNENANEVPAAVGRNQRHEVHRRRGVQGGIRPFVLRSSEQSSADGDPPCFRARR
jgi:hypothetical protein